MQYMLCMYAVLILWIIFFIHLTCGRTNSGESPVENWTLLEFYQNSVVCVLVSLTLVFLFCAIEKWFE